MWETSKLCLASVLQLLQTAQTQAVILVVFSFKCSQDHWCQSTSNHYGWNMWYLHILTHREELSVTHGWEFCVQEWQLLPFFLSAILKGEDFWTRHFCIHWLCKTQWCWRIRGHTTWHNLMWNSVWESIEIVSRNMKHFSAIQEYLITDIIWYHPKQTENVLQLLLTCIVLSCLSLISLY